ncbi:MAG: RAP domain-containing protein, partial [Alphaproteobacteria bacterium]|nr:RAP domain-containing protein [Alphaproteobacteria bacterium]
LSRLKSTNPKEQFNQQELTNIFYGHAQLGIKPEGELYEAWRNAALCRLKSKNPKEQFNQQALANIFYGHAQLGIKPDEALYEAWNKPALARLRSKDPEEKFNQQHLSNIFYGHALLGIKPERELSGAWKEAALSFLNSTSSNGKFSLKELHSIYLTMKRFSLEYLLENDFPRTSLLTTYKAKAPKGSKLQSEVYRALQEHLKSTYVSDMPQEEYWVEEIASHVDIYLASKKIVIEVDGPSHFFPETKEYKPKNKLKEEILKQTHKLTQLVRIPYYEWDELTTAESKNRYLKNKLSLSLEKNVHSGVPKIKEQEIKQIKHAAKTSTLRAEAPSFVPQATRLPPKKKLPLSSIREWKENELGSPSK